MKTVHIFRAQPVIQAEPVEPVTIEIHEPIPDVDGIRSVRAAQERFAAQGVALADAIWETCPGGTIDALIAEMLKRRASLFRVRFSAVQDADA